MFGFVFDRIISGKKQKHNSILKKIFKITEKVKSSQLLSINIQHHFEFENRTRPTNKKRNTNITRKKPCLHRRIMRKKVA